MSLAAALNDARNLAEHGKSNRGGFVTLEQITDEARRCLAAHGYAFTQTAETVDGAVYVETVFIDSEDRQVLRTGRYGVTVADRGGQAHGAALSFARRGSLQTALGITGGAEDQVVPRGQVASLGAAFTRAGITDREERLKVASDIVGRPLESSKELTEAEARRVVEELESWRG